MKFLITIPASLTHGKKPKIVPAKVFILEAFTMAQAKRRLPGDLNVKGHKIEVLNDWLDAIPTI